MTNQSPRCSVRTFGRSRGALARRLQLRSALADAVLVGNRVPACPATLACPPNPAGSLQLSKQPEYMIAVPTGLLGKRRRGPFRRSPTTATRHCRRVRRSRTPSLAREILCELACAIAVPIRQAPRLRSHALTARTASAETWEPVCAGWSRWRVAGWMAGSRGHRVRTGSVQRSDFVVYFAKPSVY